MDLESKIIQHELCISGGVAFFSLGFFIWNIMVASTFGGTLPIIMILQHLAYFRT